MRGRPRKPDEIMLLNGAWDVNPERRRAPSPKSKKPIGEPPEHLSPEQSKIWHEIIFLAPAGVLVSSDRFLLARICQLESKARDRTINGWESQLHLRMLSALGFTPSDRARISTIDLEQADNPFAAFAVKPRVLATKPS
jgi:phage terminase small subunit